MVEARGLSWSLISSMSVVVDGVNITTHCDIKRSVFEMHAGPLPGTAKVYVRDLGHTLSIATGSEITLDIEALRVWGGYVMSITREYAFPVDDTSVPANTPRYFVLDCSDYNILFSKRFIRNKADETARVPKYPAGKHDDEIVLDLFHNYLDLEGDGLTHTKVRYVGTPQEDNPGSPAVPAMSWATAMKNTALLPGAIYYIDADKDLAYADVDVADAPFSLSDVPNETTSFAYRDMAIVEDGTMLANDAFVWGTGLGQDAMTFKRYEDSASQTAHGLWQWSDYRQDLYKPQSVLKRATTYVDGSTQNNRGHKDPAVTVRCTTVKPGLRAGMKVRFICETHGFDDVIPIRSMNITFVNNESAIYKLVLAHYLDEAWNTAEFPPLKQDPPVDLRHCETPVVTLDCGLTDSFTRTVAETNHTARTTTTYYDILGTSDSGIDWTTLLTRGVKVSVDGAVAKITSYPVSADRLDTPGVCSSYLPGVRETNEGYTKQFSFSMSDLPGPTGTTTTEDLAIITFSLDSTSTAMRGIIRINVDSPGYTESYIQLSGPTGADGTTIPSAFWTVGTVYTVTWSEQGTSTTFSISAASTYSVTRTADHVTTIINPSIFFDRLMSTPMVDGNALDYPTITYSLYGFDIPEVSVCTNNRFDNFDRTQSGWGSNAYGTWSKTGTGTASVDGSSGKLEPVGGQLSVTETISSNAYQAATGFVMTILMKFVGKLNDAYYVVYSPTDDNAAAVEISDGGFGKYISVWSWGDYWESTPKTWLSDTWYLLKWQHVPGAHSSAKVWKLGEAEPVDWDVTRVAEAGITTRTNSVFEMHSIGDAVTPTTFYYDYVNFDYAGKPGVGTNVSAVSMPYAPGTLSGTTIGGGPVTIVELDPAAGTFTADPSADVIICYLEYGTDTPPGGYGGGPVYRPKHVRQLGWGTSLDGSNCTMASACIALDRHTLGVKTSTPPYMRSLQNDQTGGTDLNDAAYAWLHGFSETLAVHWGTSWASFVSMINGGRGGIIQGKYSRISNAYSAQPSFDGGHAMYINEFRADGYALVYDPLAPAPKWMPAAMLQDYAEAFAGGACNAAYTRVTG